MHLKAQKIVQQGCFFLAYFSCKLDDELSLNFFTGLLLYAYVGIHQVWILEDVSLVFSWTRGRFHKAPRFIFRWVVSVEYIIISKIAGPLTVDSKTLRKCNVQILLINTKIDFCLPHTHLVSFPLTLHGSQPWLELGFLKPSHWNRLYPGH